jgi:hypothetical protein
MVVMGVILISFLTSANAYAAKIFSFGEDRSVSIDLGLRTSYTNADISTPDGISHSSDFNFDSILLGSSASFNKYIKGRLSIQKDSNDFVRVKDAYVQLEFLDEFNVWAGRILPPSDRANLDGPYYLNTWSYPGMVSQYPAKFLGYDNGGLVWGRLFDKRLTYSAGAFEGHNNFRGASNENGNLLYAGRLQMDLWDTALDPAYYTSSTYYGDKEVLSVGIALMYQSDAVGTGIVRGDYQAWNIDALLEKKLTNIGTVTFEGAYYNYDTNNTSDNTGLNSGLTDNVGGIRQGQAYLGGVAFLFPQTLVWGKFQPYYRFQKFDQDNTPTEGGNVPVVMASISKQYDLGVNYIIDGHKARVSAVYTRNQATGTKDLDKFVMGLQLQF